MIPAPTALAILERQSTDAHLVGAGQMAREADPAAKEPTGALRIEAALRAADQDDLEWQSADGQRHEWSWTIKALPKPPLVLATNEQLNSEELLANDSLGG